MQISGDIGDFIPNDTPSLSSLPTPGDARLTPAAETDPVDLERSPDAHCETVEDRLQDWCNNWVSIISNEKMKNEKKELK